MQRLLLVLSQLSEFEILLIFLLENFLITLLVLAAGNFIIKHSGKRMGSIERKEWLICGVTNVLNAIVTYIGFKLWQHGTIVIGHHPWWFIPLHLAILFFAMDFFMFVFHYVVHHTFLYKMIHGLHHQAIHPNPIHLFFLHPIEALAFGFLWLLVLCLFSFNMYAIVIYLTLNVVFGLTGHLGIEPVPRVLRNSGWFNYLGTSTFHHRHHEQVDCNFGFYTTIWDRIFNTYRG